MHISAKIVILKQGSGSSRIVFASAPSSVKSRSLPSLLPFPASFVKVLPLPQKLTASIFFLQSVSVSTKINRFQLPHPCFKIIYHQLKAFEKQSKRTK